MDSVCVKEPSVKSALLENSDWYDREVTLTNASGFQIGDGIVLRTKNPENGSVDLTNAHWWHEAAIASSSIRCW